MDRDVQGDKNGDIVYVSGITRKMLRNVVVLYAVLSLIVLGATYARTMNEFRSFWSALGNFVLPLAIVWAIPLPFIVPVLRLGRKRGVLTLYSDHMERKTRGESRSYSYHEITDPDFSGVIARNTTSRSRPASGGKDSTKQIAVFTFRLDGLRYRFTSNTKTRQGRPLRDFMVEKVMSGQEDKEQK